MWLIEEKSMSYFVYKIIPGPTALIKELELQNSFDSFKDAKALARELRGQLEEGDSSTIKVIFADNQLHAEEMLMEHREPRLLDGNEDPI
jgi:hypothetical protein